MRRSNSGASIARSCRQAAKRIILPHPHNLLLANASRQSAYETIQALPWFVKCDSGSGVVTFRPAPSRSSSQPLRLAAARACVKMRSAHTNRLNGAPLSSTLSPQSFITQRAECAARGHSGKLRGQHRCVARWAAPCHPPLCPCRIADIIYLHSFRLAYTHKHAVSNTACMPRYVKSSAFVLLARLYGYVCLVLGLGLFPVGK